MLPAFVLWLNCTNAFGVNSNDYINREWSYKYLPITFLWCINFVLFILMSLNIITRYCNNCPLVHQQNGCCGFLRIILFACIWFTWIFEILSAKYPDAYPMFW